MATRQQKNLGPNIQYTDSEKTDINILLLGETGVGKSTFVNSFANYLQYTDFKTAESSKILALIPAKFTFPDEDFKERIVEIGSDENELNETGESATQGTKSYVFPLKDEDRKIRLIDTPGIGDTKGLEQDKINFENILSYISQFAYLHAICFLFKPNVSRINVYFKYCLQHLLCHLEKSASRNIVFVFTNSRSTFYRPGETLSNLNKILKEIEDQPPNVKIPCSKENMFCFDNEAFKFLVAFKNNIKFSEQEKKDYASSWDTSVNACWSMLGYIVGNKTLPGLMPHLVENTISINQARRLIINLSKPLADISDLINDNITVLNRHRQRVTQENMSKEELMKCLFVPTVNLKDTKLQQPVTVCTNANCCDIYPVAGKNKYNYKQKCHNPCFLNNVPEEMVGSPALSGCAAMRANKCQVCGCDFSVHMHIYYESTIFEDKLEDEGVKRQLKTADNVIEVQFKLINDIIARQEEYDKEKEIISKSTAKFAHFLKENSITPYNDAFSDYIHYLIDRENGLGSRRDPEVVRQYEDVLRQHVHEKDILDKALVASKKVDPQSAVITAQDVFDSVRALFHLQYNGPGIKNLHEQQENLRRKEHEDFTEYFHFTEIEKPKKKKNKNKGKSGNASEAAAAGKSEDAKGPNTDLQDIKKLLEALVDQDTKKGGSDRVADLGDIKIKLKDLNISGLDIMEQTSAANLLQILAASYANRNQTETNRGGRGNARFNNRSRGNYNNSGAVPKTNHNNQQFQSNRPNSGYEQGGHNQRGHNQRGHNFNYGRGPHNNQFRNNTNYNQGGRPPSYHSNAANSRNDFNPNPNYRQATPPSLFANDPNFRPAAAANNQHANPPNYQQNHPHQAPFNRHSNYDMGPQNDQGNNFNQQHMNPDYGNQGENQAYGNRFHQNQDSNNRQPFRGNPGNNSNPNFNNRSYQSAPPQSYNNANTQPRNSQFAQGHTPDQSNWNQRRGCNHPRNRSHSRNRGHVDTYNNLDKDDVKSNLSKDINTKQKIKNKPHSRGNFKKYGVKRRTNANSNNDTMSEVTSDNSADDDEEEDNTNIVVPNAEKTNTVSKEEMKKFIQEQEKLWSQTSRVEKRKETTPAPAKKLSFFDSLLKFAK